MVGSVAHAAYQSNVARSVMGSTPALVDAKFASVINHNMTLPGAAATRRADARLACYERMSEKLLELMAAAPLVPYFARAA